MTSKSREESIMIKNDQIKRYRKLNTGATKPGFFPGARTMQKEQKQPSAQTK